VQLLEGWLCHLPNFITFTTMKSFIGFISIYWLTLAALFAQKKEDRNLEPFNRLSVSGSFTVILQKGDKELVSITAEGIDLQDIETEVHANTLSVALKPYRWRSNHRITMVITYRELVEINSSGLSRIRWSESIQADKIRLTQSGSGIMEGVINSKSIIVDNAGSGKLVLSGSADMCDFTISGSGKLFAAELISKEAQVSLSGSGSVEIHVTESLKANVSGSGKVHYKGNPKREITNVSGSGSVRKI
jgi:hypothetical protein